MAILSRGRTWIPDGEKIFEHFPGSSRFCWDIGQGSRFFTANKIYCFLRSKVGATRLTGWRERATFPVKSERQVRSVLLRLGQVTMIFFSKPGLFAGFALLACGTFAQAIDGPATPSPRAEDRAPPSLLAKCLPPGIKLSDVVEVGKTMGNANAQPAGPEKITVEQKLNALKATCNRENELVDGEGRPIVFYHLIGCWGYPPPNYRELLQKQRDEIDKLKQQHTVIEMTCNPSGARIASLTRTNAALPMQARKNIGSRSFSDDRPSEPTVPFLATLRPSCSWHLPIAQLAQLNRFVQANPCSSQRKATGQLPQLEALATASA